MYFCFRSSIIDKKQPYKYHDKTTSDSSENESIFKPTKRDLAKYRNPLHSSDDEQSKYSSCDVSFFSLFYSYFWILILCTYYLGIRW